MPLTNSEIVPGCVAYFDKNRLKSSKSFTQTGTLITREGPLLCYKTINGASYWTPLTTSYRNERIMLDKNDIAHICGIFKDKQTYLQDGANTYSDANATFIDAAATTDSFSSTTRPQISGNTFRRILTEIKKRGGL